MPALQSEHSSILPIFFVEWRKKWNIASWATRYARVSSKEQNLDRQIDALKKYVPEDNIIIDKASGKNLNREGHQALKGALGLRQGDTLFIKSLDRLSRNKTDIKQELQWFREKGISLKALDLPTTMVQIGEGQEWIGEMINNILIEVLSSIAEEERRTIKQRQREGIEAAKARGLKFGRPDKGFPDAWEVYYPRYKSGELKRAYVISQLGISPDRFSYLKTKYEKSREKVG